MPTAAPLSSQTTRRLPRALVVDDHPLMVTAVATAVSAMRLFERVDVAGSFQEAQALLDGEPACGLAILDLHLRDSSAQDNLLSLREGHPDVPVLVFSGDESLENITMAFECNARGYVTKSSPMNVLKNAIELVLAGSSYIPPEAVSVLGASPTTALPSEVQALRLSGRQDQVLRLLLQGMPNKVIAARLDMAEGTVKAHLNTVFRVMGVRTRVEAILRARDLGLL